MQKTIITKAALLAVASLATGAAMAQSSLTIYGNIDIGVDNVRRSQGNIAGTAFAPPITTNPALVASYANSFSNKSTQTRLTSSISSVNALGFKGTEDLGGGYKAGFILEGQFQLDTGAQSGQDSRMWGRQAFVGLTTPVGEVRLGRQYAPMFYAFATTTVEALGGADIMGTGLVVNNLQVRQDNQVSYWLKLGGLTGEVSYSPNAGVDQKISSARGQAAGATNGQIIGGQTAGTEASSGRGRSIGLFLNYAFDFGLQTNFSYHGNKFGDTQLVSAATGATLFNMDKYHAYTLGAKYTIPGVGTQISGIFHSGTYVNDGSDPFPVDPKIRTIALGAKHPIGNFSIGIEFAQSKFTNFTKGKDTGFMLAGDYNFSKRTKLFTRIGQMKDDRGNVARTSAGVPVAGGPFPLLVGLGSLETPFFSGAGANIDGKTTVFSVGIRHSF